LKNNKNSFDYGVKTVTWNSFLCISDESDLVLEGQLTYTLQGGRMSYEDDKLRRMLCVCVCVTRQCRCVHLASEPSNF